MITCLACGRQLGEEIKGDRKASISGSILGDECTETYYLCGKCDLYTVEVYWDCFTGDEQVSLKGPLQREEGDKNITVISQCAEPWDKKCRCAAHRAYFGDALD